MSNPAEEKPAVPATSPQPVTAPRKMNLRGSSAGRIISVSEAAVERRRALEEFVGGTNHSPQSSRRSRRSAATAAAAAHSEGSESDTYVELEDTPASAPAASFLPPPPLPPPSAGRVVGVLQRTGGNLSRSGAGDPETPPGKDGHEFACKVCKEGGDVMCCDGCTAVYHLKCLGLQALPAESWYCPLCTVRRRSAADLAASAPASSEPRAKRPKRIALIDDDDDEGEEGDEDEEEGRQRWAADDDVDVEMEALLAEDDDEDEEGTRTRGRKTTRKKKKKKQQPRAKPVKDKSGRVVEKFLARRDAEDLSVEYFVKFKDMSFLHCEWVPEDSFERKPPKTSTTALVQLPYGVPVPKSVLHPSWTTIDSILEMRGMPDGGGSEFLCKWRTRGPVTWEKESDVAPLVPDLVRRCKTSYDVDAAAAEAAALAQATERFTAPEDLPAPESSPPWLRGDPLGPGRLSAVDSLRKVWFCGAVVAIQELQATRVGTVVSWIASLAETLTRGPFFLVVGGGGSGTAGVETWRYEFERTAPRLVVQTYAGSAENRRFKRAHEMFFEREREKWDAASAASVAAARANPGHLKFHVLLTTVDILLGEPELFQTIFWQAAVLDEERLSKPRQSRVLKAIERLSYRCRALLVPPPPPGAVPTREDIAHVAAFLTPRFNTAEAQTLLTTGKDGTALAEAQALVRQYTLTVMSDVSPVAAIPGSSVPSLLHGGGGLGGGSTASAAPPLPRRGVIRRQSLPPPPPLTERSHEVREVVIPVALTRVEREQYARVLALSPALAMFENTGEAKAAYVRLLTMLFSVINSPPQGANAARALEVSGKLAALDRLLSGLKSRNSRSVVFSPVLETVRAIEVFLRERGHTVERVDGTLTSEERSAAIRRFNSATDGACLALCARAAFLGESLLEADTLVQYDCDFSYTADAAEFSRALRSDRLPERCALICRLVAIRTAEEAVFLLTRQGCPAHVESLTLGDMFAAVRHCQTDYAQDARIPPPLQTLSSPGVLERVLDSRARPDPPPFPASTWTPLEPWVSQVRTVDPALPGPAGLLADTVKREPEQVVAAEQPEVQSQAAPTDTAISGQPAQASAALQDAGLDDQAAGTAEDRSRAGSRLLLPLIGAGGWPEKDRIAFIGLVKRLGVTDLSWAHVTGNLPKLLQQKDHAELCRFGNSFLRILAAEGGSSPTDEARDSVLRVIGSLALIRAKVAEAVSSGKFDIDDGGVTEIHGNWSTLELERSPWTKEHDLNLLYAITTVGYGRWNEISDTFPALRDAGVAVMSSLGLASDSLDARPYILWFKKRVALLEDALAMENAHAAEAQQAFAQTATINASPDFANQFASIQQTVLSMAAALRFPCKP